MREQFNQWIEAVEGTNFQFLIQKEFLIIAGLALALLLLLLLLRLCPSRKIRAFKGETGSVEVSRHALIEMVHSACEQMPEVRKPSIKIKAGRKLNLSVRIRVDGSTHLRDTASFLQSHLKDALENQLGIERLGEIKILVTGVRAAPKPTVDLNPTERDPEFKIRKKLPTRKSEPPAPIRKEATPPAPEENLQKAPETPSHQETSASSPEPNRHGQSDPSSSEASTPADVRESSDLEKPPVPKPGPTFFQNKKK
ncbi:MAG: alkaline shock response membrane anchor protein AmaP [Puniceicoccales bacterium]